jgi:hypothetical protein
LLDQDLTDRYKRQVSQWSRRWHKILVPGHGEVRFVGLSTKEDNVSTKTRPAARKTSIESCQYKRVQYREAKECRKGRATLRETRSPFRGGRLGWNLICVEKEASLVISQWLVHEKEVQRFIVEMGWENWVVSVELQMTSETGWGVVGASCWKSIKMGGVNNLMGSCSPGGC